MATWQIKYLLNKTTSLYEIIIRVNDNKYQEIFSYRHVNLSSVYKICHEIDSDIHGQYENYDTLPLLRNNMKSLILKGAKSTFVTSEKDGVCLCEFVHASMGNSILNLQYLLFARYIRIRNAF